MDRSLHFGADTFIKTNIYGVQVLLDACRAFGVKRFLQVSTDEVYGSLGSAGKFSESSPIQPNNPYAATKASADFMVRAAHKSHGLDAVITRCSNNFGPYQFPEKLIPLMIANALENKSLPVYGDGMHVRDWIFVLDHCAAIDVVLRKAAPGSIYNIGSDHDVPNIEIVRLLLKILGKPESLIKFVEDRPGHDRRYAMDSGKIRKELGWKPSHSFEEALRETVKWYLDNKAWLDHIRSGEYTKYYDKLYCRPPRKGRAQMIEKTLSSKTVFQGRLLKVEVVEVELDRGVRSRREIVRHPGAVAVVAQLPDKRFVFVRQYRKAVESSLLEIVAGCLERGENPDNCARREIKEETGYDVGSLKKLCVVALAPGYSSEKLHVYFARLKASRGIATPDEDERVDVVCLTASAFERMVRNGKIGDSKTLAGWLLYKTMVAAGLGKT